MRMLEQHVFIAISHLWIWIFQSSKITKGMKLGVFSCKRDNWVCL